MSGRGLEAQLDALHGLLTTALQEELEAARQSDEPINPQLLDKVMKFLAMNGVTAPAASPKVDLLATTLADLDLDAEVLQRHQH